MNKLFFVCVLACFGLNTFAQDIELPAPRKTGGKPLMEAISLRQSNRNISEKDLNNQTISDLLWVAYGFNRSGKRVVPSANNKQEYEVYVTLKTGIYLYDAQSNKLILKVKGDHRKSAGKQEYVAVAPLNFLYVANLETSSRDMAHADCGFIAENVYLYCASEGLGVVIRANIDKEEVSKLLNLNKKQEVILGQTVGYIAQ